MFVNSQPPQFRRSRQYCVELASHEAHFINHTSYIDTTLLVCFDAAVIEQALADAERLTGRIAPAIRERIVLAALEHEALPTNQRVLFEAEVA